MNRLGMFMVSALMLFVCPQAGAVIIDFQSEAVTGTGVGPVGDGSSYDEDGFNIAIDVGGLAGTAMVTLGDGRGDYTGSAAMVFNLNTAATLEFVLTKIGGGAFSVSSVDLAKWITTTDQSVSFVGNKNGGGTVTQMFTLSDSDFLADTYTFTSFSNLNSLQWSTSGTSGNRIQFDNFSVSAVIPEPSALVLCLLGIGVAAFYRVRSRPARTRCV